MKYIIFPNYSLVVTLLLFQGISSSVIPECFFEGCKCVSIGSLFDVMCVSESRQAKFPPRSTSYSNLTNININTFLIKKYDFRSIPDDSFKNLRINNLIIGENNMRIITKNTFRGVKSILLLRVIENNLDSFEKNSFSWLNDTLNEVGLWQLNFKSGNIDSIFDELSTLSNLKTLKIMGYNMKKFKASWLPLLKHIHSFSLASNNLNSIQSNLFTLSTNLISLDLSNNLLDDLSDTIAAVRPLESILKELKLNGNNIENLIDFPHFEMLEILDLSNNRFKHIRSHTFINLPSLSHLYLSDNRLEAIDETSFINNTNLAVLLLSGNYLSDIPNIKTNLRLKIVDMSNQNKMLTEIREYAFERISRPLHPMNINLGSNGDLIKFDSRSFCTRTSNTTEILALDVSFESMKSFNKCLLKQLSSIISPKIVLRIGLPLENVRNYSSVCTCEMKNYASSINVEISGTCDMKYRSNDCGKGVKSQRFEECQSLEFACL
jgi:Leucine-rich repeat (LRR) protein